MLFAIFQLGKKSSVEKERAHIPWLLLLRPGLPSPKQLPTKSHKEMRIASLAYF
jgi:hypothetical protein